ncbi:hypothetical protein A3H38_03235 [candidate division WOR-1 bacterium RIFCSPLOWO2_02_FULL_46_20]|uniref:POTRA domain-containing protein n=1 Tax=candidate division WOR-1 bacterium RIFCSPLOWO2_02_FULL_46_20 TaxID=1802567 RepID=A0A1F4RG96_UNCSA|nr:MAG: hypothetical protein A3J44_02580 [candidate division WOR-1 bacterium RIFCSPHIGHO2_02_FULL_45_12]OGC07202.1 MAG: hypothetical protein A3H38_03235 [candidate division WOR-1 bacterium RIFCSPLOWO2_02_FULL_46_20]
MVRKRKFLPLVILIIVVAAAMAAIYLSTLPIWEIRDVVVNGARQLSADEIRALAGIPRSGNLFWTSFSRARSNLSKITAIKNVHFYRIPPGTVLISLTERQPLAAIVFSERSVVIDKEGFIINRNENLTLNIPNMVDLPVISGINAKRVLRADRVSEEILLIVSNIILKLKPFLETRKMQINLGELENVSFLLDDLLLVRMGNAREVKRKMEVFEALLPVIADKWTLVNYVDVSYPDNPVISYK